ncbi:MAG TPA: hypothetical protein VK135_02595 [Candidatus Dormibacteraeota bacterium]|nr:hypothetical protein [Candidatus Dormibacteraeota bacterium]
MGGFRRSDSYHYEKLQAIGYTGAYGSVKVFIAVLRKKKWADMPLDTEYHSRRDVRHILWQNDLADETERDIINRVLTQYPIIQLVYVFIASFHETITQKANTGFIALIRYEQQRQDPLTKHFIQKNC